MKPVQNVEKNIHAIYKYPLEIIPIIEALFLRLEINYKSFVFSKCTNEVSEDFKFQERISSQMSSFTQNLQFIPPEYAAIIGKPASPETEDRRALMMWYSSMIKHLRSFSTFSYKDYLSFRTEIADVDEGTSASEFSVSNCS